MESPGNLDRFNESKSRRFGCLIIPFVSADDAATDMQRPDDHFRKNSKTIDVPMSQHVVEIAETFDVDSRRLFEIALTGSKGPGSQKVVMGRVGRFVLIMSFIGYENDWTWAEVASIVSLQTFKLRS
jgi:hypothetical protein